MRLHWRHTDYHRLSGADLPEAPGVYAILRVRRASSIPLATSVLYVGQSKNLRRRFLTHVDPLRQHNKGLNAVNDRTDMEFWYAAVAVANLDLIERQLIRELDPQTNVLRYANAPT